MFVCAVPANDVQMICGWLVGWLIGAPIMMVANELVADTLGGMLLCVDRVANRVQRRLEQSCVGLSGWTYLL